MLWDMVNIVNMSNLGVNAEQNLKFYFLFVGLAVLYAVLI